MKKDSWPIAKMPFPAQTILYVCNRGMIYNREKRKITRSDQEIVTQKRQYSKTKYCNCGFKVKVVEPVE